jgi:hypothetical protein
LAPRNGDPRHCIHRLYTAWLALVALPVVAEAMATPAAASPPQHSSQSARFSDLAELTPANVQGLLPLLSHTTAVKDDYRGSLLQPRATGHSLQVDSLAGVDLRLQRFLDERAHLQPAIEEPMAAQLAGVPGREISYPVGTPAVAPSPPAGEKRELRAWDPIGRRVVWSVTEALPTSAHTLITAGGLVFYGTSDGWLKALDVRTGRTLWKHRAEGRKLEEPFSYRGADGYQYIAVYSLPRDAGDSRQTVLIFALAH